MIRNAYFIKTGNITQYFNANMLLVLYFVQDFNRAADLCLCFAYMYAKSRISHDAAHVYVCSVVTT